MIILRKRFDNPSKIYDGLKTVLGSTDIIITSMESYLMKDINRYLGGHDIILCDSITGTNSGTSESTITHKYNNTITGTDFEAKRIAELSTGNDIANISSSKTPLPNCTKYTSDIAINYVNTRYNFDTYDQFVKWAIYVIENNYPSPFSLGYPNSMYTLKLDKDNFLITFPNGIGFGITVGVLDKSIVYNVDIVYKCDSMNQILFMENDVYKSAIKNGWESK